MSTPQIPSADIARAYRWPRQRIHQLEKKYGLEVILAPAKLFDRLLKTERSSNMRTALCDPQRRANVARRITLMQEREAHRQTVRDLTEKINQALPD